MNEKVSKSLRRCVYGNGSKRNEYDYITEKNGARVCAGKRQPYLQLKKKEKT